ncbi:MAG TPA: hypothetical protein VHI13_11535 [Candidatus Kapabacteria bacterium]|nr:hypothetical protein [Candidatus Kapabacteria bacterium]
MSRPFLIRTALAAAIMVAVSPGVSFACDFCGCLLGINPYYTLSDRITLTMLWQQAMHPAGGFGINAPHLKIAAGAVGTGYAALYSAGAPRLYHGGSIESTVPTYESRGTVEIAVEHHFGDHLMATGIVPLMILNERGDRLLSVRGIGDPSLLIHYVAAFDLAPGTRATFLAGAGADIPLGSDNLVDARGVRLDPRLQPGSGTADFLGNVRGILQREKWTLAVDVLGRTNGVNSYGDRIGSSLGVTMDVSRDIVRSNQDLFAIVGTAGLRSEMAATDRVHGAVDPASGFTAAYAKLGAQLVYSDLRITLTALIPMYDHRAPGGDSEGTRIAAGAGFEF